MKIALIFSLLLTMLLYSVVAQVPTLSSDGSLTSELETFLKEQSAKGFSGDVLVVREGKIILDKTYGLPKSTLHPRFWLASNSKQFVAAALMKLQEQGKLSVQDPITRFLKKVPPDKQKMTLHQLLTHTSGLPHRYIADGIVKRDEAVRAILALPLEWPIGQAYHYSNDGYNLLAAIIEVASGNTFEKYLQEELFKPAGMKQTGFWGFQGDAPLAPLANAEQAKSQKPNIFHDGKSVANWGYRGATGLFSTTDDLYLWLRALQNGLVLNKKSVEQMWSPQVLIKHSLQKDKDICYGYGWGVVTLGGKRVEVNHAGDEDWLGHNGVIHLYDNGNAYIVLSNAGEHNDGTWSSIVSQGLSEKLH